MSYCIRISNQNDIPKLKDLWKETFLDSDEYINRFFQNAYSESIAIVALNNDELIGMMFLLKSKFVVSNIPYKAGYVYAVATKKEYRKKGVMSALNKYLQKVAKANNINVLALVPANDSLFYMYEKIGYKKAFYLGQTVLSVYPKNEVTIKEATLEYFIAARKLMLYDNKSSFMLSDKLQEYTYYEAKTFGDVLQISSEDQMGYIVGYNDKMGTYFINETNLKGELLLKAAATLRKRLEVKKVILISKTGVQKPFGMLKFIDEDIDYIGKNPYMNLMLN